MRLGIVDFAQQIVALYGERGSYSAGPLAASGI